MCGYSCIFNLQVGIRREQFKAAGLPSKVLGGAVGQRVQPKYHQEIPESVVKVHERTPAEK